MIFKGDIFTFNSSEHWCEEWFVTKETLGLWSPVFPYFMKNKINCMNYTILYDIYLIVRKIFTMEIVYIIIKLVIRVLL